MPRLPDVPNVLKVELIYSNGGGPAVNLLHFLWSGSAPSATDCSAIAAGVAAQWQSYILPLLSTNLILEDCVVTDLSSSTSATGASHIGVAGADGNPVLDAAASIVLSHKIARRYRGGHPRTYLPGIVQTALSDVRTIGASLVTTLDAAFANFLSHFVGTGFGATSIGAFVAVSYVDKTVNPVAPFRRVSPLVENVVSTGTQKRLCTQRRRLGTLFPD